jgi:hypothetical protein
VRAARLLVPVAIALALALAFAAVASAQENPWPTTIAAERACPGVDASLSAVVDAEAQRVYLRLVLTNGGNTAALLPIALEKYPCYEAATLVLRHEESAREILYPGPMAVVFWQTPAPRLEAGAHLEFPFALTPVWFEQPGRWSVVWRRAITEPDGEQSRVRLWQDVSERVEFEIPAGFGTPKSPG